MLPPRPPSNGSTSKHGMIHPDDAIRQTDDDASSSRASAISLGYLSDPFSPLLYKPSLQPGQPSSSSRKPPLINIGTHHRTIGIDTLVNQFLQNDRSVKKQVVSLGAGSDTRFWRLMSQPVPPNISKYVEIDFPHLTSPKAHRISRSKKLHSVLPPSSTSSFSTPYKISQGGTRLDSAHYTLLPLDLRPSPSQSIHQLLDEHLLPLLEPTLPTLFLAECLFPYMPPGDSQSIISWFGERFDRCVGVVYEMSGLDDSFGRVMKRNLASRNLSIPGSDPFSTPQSQAQRFLDPSLGKGVFEKSGVKTLWQVREEVIDPQELQRISKIEILDEIEELKLVLEHYVIAWGIKGDDMQSIGL
ncbi:hypothetical protein I302_104783 [Kwoniella bestiolae CBS 10118]|uniref:Leucine carboxyl methyltransferase 1 n=1 Tax=Kwoniella bestiolae CBS 10118 TaxID=1296100 RepID=A0A1B9FRS0_9TREE|nr:leucine carboxyl methyltransferase 1 [Kwoniella bestiolae CBS 10118]OCF21469.1 leucine carboxyl methyltransferase 1 [Kwoniella bestiolae CBS 10118]